LAEVVPMFSRFSVVMMIFVLLALASVVLGFRSVVRFSVMMLGLVVVYNLALRKTVTLSDLCFFSYTIFLVMLFGLLVMMK
jgi:hypothetical protein